jgi:hypothetical protein
LNSLKTTPRITSIAQLHAYLHAALQLEHATLPPYLTALYSIRPGTNLDAVQILRVVAIEEMLHLTLVANLLNAVGGTPDLTRPDFIPRYPTPLPDGETDFQVDVQRFSVDAVNTFLKIERPRKAPDESSRHRGGGAAAATCSADMAPGYYELCGSYYSIGEFYDEILRGVEYLEAAHPGALFVGDPSRQVTSEYYYAAGGKLLAVTDLASACAAIRLIAEQGEGHERSIYDHEGELSHYYRFEQLLLGRYYRKAGATADEPGKPTGPALHVEWDAVYPIKTNVHLEDYEPSSELHGAAVEFNEVYAGFLRLLTQAYAGQPRLLLDAVPYMYRIRERLDLLLRNPLPGASGLHAAPTFEPAAARAVRS